MLNAAKKQHDMSKPVTLSNKSKGRLKKRYAQNSKGFNTTPAFEKQFEKLSFIRECAKNGMNQPDTAKAVIKKYDVCHSTAYNLIRKCNALFGEKPLSINDIWAIQREKERAKRKKDREKVAECNTKILNLINKLYPSYKATVHY